MRPFVSVLLMGRLPSLALVDSGADVTLFPAELMSALGLEAAEARRECFAIGYGGIEGIAYYFEVQLSIRGFPPFMADVGFSERLTNYGILGHYGFFDRFSVTFPVGAEYFEITSGNDQRAAEGLSPGQKA